MSIDPLSVKAGRRHNPGTNQNKAVARKRPSAQRKTSTPAVAAGSASVAPAMRSGQRSADGAANIEAPDDLTRDERYPAFRSAAHLDLIVSVDLRGSTFLKTDATGLFGRDCWMLEIEDFYRFFPKALAAAYRRLPTFCSQTNFRTAARLQVFKFLADEVLFHVELERHEQSAFHIEAIKWAVRTFNEQRPGDMALQCKATAWLAGFPVTDLEVPIVYRGHKNLPPDFIGPSMDIGFRLAKYAKPRKLVVSYDLALMIIDALEMVPMDQRDITFYYDGSESLKGVLGGFPYPIIWINVYDKQLSIESQLRGIEQKPCQMETLRQFCRNFQAEHHLSPWFIKTDGHPHYQGPNREWFERHLVVEQMRQQRGRHRPLEKQSPPSVPGT